MSASTNETLNVVQGIYDYYTYTFGLSDQRTKGWALVDSPIPVLALIGGYLSIVYFGPRLMSNYKPFKIREVLIGYNIFMMLLNVYIAARLFFHSYRLEYSYICQPCRQIYTFDEIEVAKAVWWYYVSKLLDFIDTFFFILRKKHNQLSFLHVYHHSTMFFFWWIGIKWVPTGATFLPAMANSLIHALMYFYYGLSVFGSQLAKYLWWKKYITIIQIIQFVVALSLGVNGLLTNCDFPLWMHYTLIAYMMSFIALFGKFYTEAYLKKYKDYRKDQEELKKKELMKTD